MQRKRAREGALRTQKLGESYRRYYDTKNADELIDSDKNFKDIRTSAKEVSDKESNAKRSQEDIARIAIRKGFFIEIFAVYHEQNNND